MANVCQKSSSSDIGKRIVSIDINEKLISVKVS